VREIRITIRIRNCFHRLLRTEISAIIKPNDRSVFIVASC
jgi:hypothetical protein